MPETIDCKRFLPLLEDFVDGEVAGDQLGELQGHLRECPQCFGRVETMRHIQGMVRAAVPPLETPELLRRRIARDFGVSPFKRRMRQPWVRPALLAACFMILLAGALLWLRRPEPAAWSVAMVSDHTMCWMAETGKPHEVPNLKATLRKYLAGTEPALPALAQTAFVNLKPCPVEGAVASAHMFYTRPGEQQLSLYFATQDQWSGQLPDSPARARIDSVDSGGKTYQVASWQHKGVVTGLVAAISRQEMEELARATRYTPQGQASIPGAVLLASGHLGP